MIIIDHARCNGCGLCEAGCFFHAISMEKGIPVFNDTCVSCGQCVDLCESKALTVECEQCDASDLTDYKNVWSVLEMEDGRASLKKASLELVCKGRELADKLKQQNIAICICKRLDQDSIDLLEACGCDELILVESPAAEFYDTDVYTDILFKLAKSEKPAIVLLPATENGRDLAPRVSARLRTGLTADCTGLEIDEENQLVQIRPTYGGNIMASILTPKTRPQMASIRPATFAIRRATCNSYMKIRRISEQCSVSPRVERLEGRKKELVFRDVSEASIVLAGGFGLGKNGFELLHKLAKLIDAAVGATRKPVDLGWIPYDMQIGQTGKTIAPDLYIACGISGSLQHSIGIKNAKKIIAINNDPVAPIFTQSDIAILGDACEVLRVLIEMIEANGTLSL